MSSKSVPQSSDLVNVNPRAYDDKLRIEKDTKSLAELRSSFSKQQCSVLSQVRDFLPKMASANKDLTHKMSTDPTFSADIEQVEDDTPHIEMNIAMFEQEDEDSEASDMSDSSEGEVTLGGITEHNIKLQKHKKSTKGDKQGCLIECIEHSDVPSTTDLQQKTDSVSGVLGTT